MQLKRIQHYIDQYKSFLKSQDREAFLYIWESQQIFQERWDLEVEDLQAMYDAVLQNSQTRRLWKGHAYEPKLMMLHFIEMQPAFVKQMFQDLFDESKDLEGRCSRFVFYCDTLLENYKEAYPLKIENNHYHDDDYHMIFLYLAFRYPESYTLYDADSFRKLLEVLGSPDIPQANDVERFAKVMLTLNRFLAKDEALQELHQQRLEGGTHYIKDSLLLVFDFYQCITRPWPGLQEFDPKS
ncbi:MAG: hypothetical protein MI974_12385 [Chitinophagales bacterium]|nr:hypothetical protein [Chitinophagales bacterium]